MIRKVLAVIVGYIVFAGSAVALFQLSGHKAHAEATIGFMVITAIYGTSFSIIAGWVAQSIARSGSLTINFVLAFMIAAFAAFSMIKSDGSPWSQLEAIFIFAPASIAGGVLYFRRVNRSA